jgi:EAL domain-containing protein (putative c-di-GMP-specific phosphodiesterase class I)
VDSAIVRAVIDLANAMGISTVAEGVETEGQLAGLRTLGCPVAQGFYFSQPLRADEFDDLLTRHFACTHELRNVSRTPPGGACRSA